ncbi:MAG: hypothetical protein A3G93_08860 [Nitrospinae bacterium RIFCSPLOWO2_12_FULL_45_22]|nr:MAG: hypothetical protein A3G93_08860 [Nitrospinae bacterium RIFCSPLOWO2_12_FULL_45_22]
MIKKLFCSLISISFFSTFCTGCATVVHGSRQSISINSSPSSATVTVNGHKASTPTTLSLKRKKEYIVTVEKDGYEKGQAIIEQNFNGWSAILGNIIWLVPGLIIDYAVGGMWTLSPENVTVTLQKKGED